MTIVMKRCILMFALLITVLLLTVFTDAKRSTELDQELAIGKNVMEKPFLVQESRDTIK